MFAAGRAALAVLASLIALSAPPDNAPHTRSFVEVNGARLELLDFGGDGPLMVFLPGFRNTAHVFDDLAPEFTDRFHVVALTPRGIPVSGAPDSGYTIAQLAADVHTLLDSLGVHSAILAGHSIAGAIMTRFGEAYPAQLTAAILSRCVVRLRVRGATRYAPGQAGARGRHELGLREVGAPVHRCRVVRAGEGSGPSRSRRLGH